MHTGYLNEIEKDFQIEILTQP